MNARVVLCITVNCFSLKNVTTHASMVFTAHLAGCTKKVVMVKKRN
jgi:hypothetical protein